VVARYNLGRHTAAPLGAIWLVQQRPPDEGKSLPLGPCLLDGTVG
jgi:hypothetical protein